MIQNLCFYENQSGLVCLCLPLYTYKIQKFKEIAKTKNANNRNKVVSVKRESELVLPSPCLPRLWLSQGHHASTGGVRHVCHLYVWGIFTSRVDMCTILDKVLVFEYLIYPTYVFRGNMFLTFHCIKISVCYQI